MSTTYTPTFCVDVKHFYFQFFVVTGTGHSDDMDAVQQVYTSRYGTGYSMYDEFSGRPKPNVSRTASLLDRPSSSLERGTYLSPEDTVPEVRVRSYTEGSIGTSGTFRGSLKDGEKGKIDSLDSQRTARKSKASMESLDALVDQDGDDKVMDGMYSGYRRLKPGGSQDGSSRIGQTQMTKPRASVVVATTSATQLGDADILFKSLLKYLGIAKKPPKPLKFAKKFGEVSATFHLSQLKVNIAEMSRSRSKEKRAKRESSGRLSSTFPAFSCEDIGFKVSVKEVIPSHESVEDKTSPTEMKGSIAAGLEKKDEMTGMAICISARCGKIMQVVEMPFLRVASQLAGVAKMIQLQQSSSMDQIKLDPVHVDSPGSLDNEDGANEIQLGPIDTPDGSPLRGQGSDHIDACSASIGSSQDEGLPKCWQTMYHLINLYSGVAEPVSIDTTRVLMNPVFNVENELQGRTVMGQTTVDE